MKSCAKNRLSRVRDYMTNIFFIIGCARSGTTAITKILSTANNAELYVEETPKLCLEARDLYKGDLEKAEKVLKEAKEKRIKETTGRGIIYGDKNPNYLPFIPHLELLWQPKFIFIVRDGREVVRSLMDWHEISEGNIFGMSEDEEGSTITSPKEDWWDYSRLRPNPGEPYSGQWKTLSRFEKCSWYWNKFNLLMLDYASKLDKERWRLININKTTAEDFEEIFDFLGLRGFNIDKIDTMLNTSINSATDRGGISKEFPRWDNWSEEQTKIFDKHSGDLMKRLGFS